ncbi:MAG: hypothetical protein LVQ97_00730 [Candidatus Micrarchaeales archaeon]|jgi:hypothetical protein|uniref:Uncharacterized protein n=1 Tax=Candidatus Micrarchaeum acidiphilum ARMAN-2 TaxID=425595 RepID=C7DHM3_MICA2|nr:MAG: hypothetical protein UNLARM2_0566 [Candidatus Micrarchaeum acidiphilum ARMAN-2]MCW6160696.1 hypothetical protein [Candidatus Micrarchaeales archaeon]
MFGIKSKSQRADDTVESCASKYSNIEGLPRLFKEKVEEFSQSYAQYGYSRARLQVYFANRMSADYIVKFINSDIDLHFANEVFEKIAKSCYNSTSLNSIDANEVEDKKLHRMLNALGSLKAKPELQMHLLEIYSGTKSSGPHMRE